MVLADAAFQFGQLIGAAILVLVIIGVVRTLTRSDLTLREKILGESKNSSEDNLSE